MSEKHGVFDERNDAEKPGDLSTPSQKPMALRSADYVDLGFVPVVPAPDGGVLIAGGDPPGPALMLTTDNLVCTEIDGARPGCEHFVQFLTEAEGVIKGFGEQPKQIKRYCTKLSTASELMEIGEVAVFACSARKPQDLVSISLIKNFEKRQREIAAEHSQVQGEREL